MTHCEKHEKKTIFSRFGWHNRYWRHNFYLLSDKKNLTRADIKQVDTLKVVVSCGIREDKGVWGDRMRIPFDEVYRKI